MQLPSSIRSPAALVALVVLCCVMATAAEGKKYKIKKHYAKYIPGSEGVSLFSDILYPDPADRAPNQTFPLIVFPNSWGCPEFEYVLQALKFAEDGYVTIEYATRGWWFSSGEIDVAGPKDRADGSAVIDWALANAAELGVDASKIGFAGISYGAGISLQMAGFDSRVVTAAAMSGWANLSANLYNEHSTSTATVKTLVDIANKSAHPSPGLLQMYADLMTHTNISEALAYGDQRGAEMFISQLNARQVPLLFSNNYLDRIFYPQLMTDTFYNALTGPKHMLGNCGGHAEAEGFGLLGIENHVWTRVKEWFAYWLQGVDNGIMSRNPVSFQLEGSVFTDSFQEFSAWPAPATELMWQSYDFVPRGSNSFGGLNASNNATSSAHKQPVRPHRRGKAASEEQLTAPEDAVWFTRHPPLYDGQGHQDKDAAMSGVFPAFNLSGISRRHSISYVSEPFATATRICGVPFADVTFATSSSRWQVYGYLFDIAPSATTSGSVIGSILSDTSMTRWDAADGASSARLTFHTMCRDFAAGDSLGVGLVLFNKRYAAANEDDRLWVALEAAVSSLSVPIVVAA